MDTYAGQYDGHIIPLVTWSVNPPPTPEHVYYPTQKPALDIRLDNKRSVTARVGRMSNGTDAPMTWSLRLSSNSVGDKVAVNVDMAFI